VIHFVINYKQATDCYRHNNNADILSKISEEVATEIAKKCRRRQPHCHLTPLPEEP